MELGCVTLSRTFMPPNSFVRTAYRLFGDAATDSHKGAASSCFSYRVANGALLVAWGRLLPALSRTGLPVRFVSPPLPGRDQGAAVLLFHHTTPTLLKRCGGSKAAWFDPEGYARAVAGVLGVAGINASPEEVARRIRFLRVRTSESRWDLGRGVEKGFVGDVLVSVPAAWAGPLKIAELTGIGCKRGWGMGNVVVKKVQRRCL